MSCEPQEGHSGHSKSLRRFINALISRNRYAKKVWNEAQRSNVQTVVYAYNWYGEIRIDHLPRECCVLSLAAVWKIKSKEMSRSKEKSKSKSKEKSQSKEVAAPDKEDSRGHKSESLQRVKKDAQDKAKDKAAGSLKLPPSVAGKETPAAKETAAKTAGDASADGDKSSQSQTS